MDEQNDPGQRFKQSEAEPTSPLFNAYVDQQVQQAIRKHHESEHKGKRLRNSWRAASPISKGSFVMTGGIAIATIFYSVVAIFQLIKMSGQLQTMNKTYGEIQKQTIAAQGASTAASESAGTSRDALVDVQRAFVFPSPIVVRASNPDGFYVSVEFENSGYTPTRNMTLHVNDQMMKEIPKNFKFPDLWAVGTPHINTPSYIGPKGHVSIFLPLFMPVEAAKAAIGDPNRQTLFMWGWVRYQDIFEGTDRHESIFCYNFVPVPNPPDSNGKSRDMTLAANSCPVHNCYDSECPDHKKQRAIN